MEGSTIVWIAGIVLAFVFVDVLLVEIRRCMREGKRLARRIAAYADLPIIALLAAGSDDLMRIAAAVERVPELVVRAETALAALGLRKPASP